MDNDVIYVMDECLYFNIKKCLCFWIRKSKHKIKYKNNNLPQTEKKRVFKTVGLK